MRHPRACPALRALRVHDHRARTGSGREDVLLRSLCGRSGRERLGGSRVSDSIKEEPKTSRRKICVPILSEEEKDLRPHLIPSPIWFSFDSNQCKSSRASRTEKESSPEKTRWSVLPSGLIHLVGNELLSPGAMSQSSLE